MVILCFDYFFDNEYIEKKIFGLISKHIQTAYESLMC